MKISVARREYLIEIEVRKFTPKTIRCYRNNLDLFLRFCEEEAKITEAEELTLAVVRQFSLYMSARGKKGSYINGLLKVAKAFIQYCYDEGYGGFNTRKNFKWCKQDKAVVMAFEPEDVRKMMQSCKGYSFLQLRDAAVLTALFETGIRCWELCCMGGKGDKDWFTFESAFDEGENSKMYTLNLLDLNTDYSDEFCYDLYAPDGTLLMDGIEVEIRHNNIIACEQEGLYALCLYRTSSTSPRSDLRIRVDEGGADPYEPNDTWLAAAEVQAEQPIQFILSNTEDADWFKFEVPEAYMTMHLSDVSNVAFNLYCAENLEEFGTDEPLAGYSRYSYTDYYYQINTPGTYYLEVYSNLAHISQDLRTLTISLEEATAEEPNNTWKAAIPIYEGVPMEYNLTAWNDSDWFVFDVPEGTKSLYIPDNWESYDHRRCLYREDDFETAGDNAASIWEWNHGGYTLNYPTAGTYYLNCKYSSTSMYAVFVAGDEAMPLCGAIRPE